MSGDGFRILQLTPPTGDGVQCKAMQRERADMPWSDVVPLLQEIQIGSVPAGSVLKSYENGWATFATKSGDEMRFDLREPLKLQAGANIPAVPHRPN